MSEERYRYRERSPLAPSGGDNPFGTASQPSATLQQASGFGAAASQANESCQRGANAQAELNARDQESGQ